MVGSGVSSCSCLSPASRFPKEAEVIRRVLAAEEALANSMRWCKPHLSDLLTPSHSCSSCVGVSLQTRQGLASTISWGWNSLEWHRRPWLIIPMVMHCSSLQAVVHSTFLSCPVCCRARSCFCWSCHRLAGRRWLLQPGQGFAGLALLRCGPNRSLKAWGRIW